MRLGLGSSLDNASWALDWATAHGHPTAVRPAIAAGHSHAGVLVALFPIHEVELVPGSEDDGSVRDFLGAHLGDLVGGNLALAHVKLESAFLHVDALGVSELRQRLCLALHILGH